MFYERENNTIEESSENGGLKTERLRGNNKEIIEDI